MVCINVFDIFLHAIYVSRITNLVEYLGVVVESSSFLFLLAPILPLGVAEWQLDRFSQVFALCELRLLLSIPPPVVAAALSTHLIGEATNATLRPSLISFAAVSPIQE